MESLHEDVADCLQKIGRGDHDIPLWFTQGKTTLVQKVGEFSSENKRPIEWQNTVYKIMVHFLPWGHWMSF